MPVVAPSASSTSIPSSSEEPISWRTLLGHKFFSQDEQALIQHAKLAANRNSCNAKQELIEIVLSSRHELKDPSEDQQLVVAASNAISILNYAGLKGIFSFNFQEVRDWSKVRIPFSNLNCAQLCNCNFDHADLSHASMVNTVMSGGSFRKAKLQGLMTFERGPLVGHEGCVNAVAFSADAKLLVSGATDKTVRVWDVETGELISTLTYHKASVDCVAYSSDGQFVATGCDSGFVGIWSVADGAWQRRVTGDRHTWGVKALCFSPDGKLLASASADQTIRIWDVKLGECTAVLEGHESSVTCLDFSHDGAFLVSGSMDETVRIWDLQCRGLERTLMGEDLSFVCDVSCSPLANIFAVASEGYNVRIWDRTTGCFTKEFAGSATHIAVKFAPDGQVLFTGSYQEGVICMWSPTSERCMMTIPLRKCTLASLSCSTDGLWLAAGLEDKTIVMWSLGALRSPAVPLPRHTAPITNILPSANAQTLVSISQDNSLRVWKLETGQCKLTLEIPHLSLPHFTLSRSGAYFAIQTRDRFVSQVWDVDTGTRKAVAEHFWDDPICSLAVNEDDGGELASAAVDGWVIIWSIEQDRLTKSICLKTYGVDRLLFSPDSKYLLTTGGSEEKQQKSCLWRLEDQEIDFRWKPEEEHGSSIRHAVFSPDGQWIATSASTTWVGLWRRSDLSFVMRLDGSLEDVQQLCFSLNSRLLACRANDGFVHVWDVMTGDRITMFEADLPHGRNLAFSPDSKLIALGLGSDNSILVWNLEKDEILARLQGRTYHPDSVCFSPDGKLVVVELGEDQSTMYTWEIECKSRHCKFRLRSILGSHWTELASADFKGADLDGNLKRLIETHNCYSRLTLGTSTSKR